MEQRSRDGWAFPSRRRAERRSRVGRRNPGRAGADARWRGPARPAPARRRRGRSLSVVVQRQRPPWSVTSRAVAGVMTRSRQQVPPFGRSCSTVSTDGECGGVHVVHRVSHGTSAVGNRRQRRAYRARLRRENVPPSPGRPAPAPYRTCRPSSGAGCTTPPLIGRSPSSQPDVAARSPPRVLDHPRGPCARRCRWRAGRGGAR